MATPQNRRKTGRAWFLGGFTSCSSAAWSSGRTRPASWRKCDKILQFVTDDKRRTQEAAIQTSKNRKQRKLPPINQGMPQPAAAWYPPGRGGRCAGGPRGRSFFQDTRTQGEGPSRGAGGMGNGRKPRRRAVPPSPRRRTRLSPPPPRRRSSNLTWSAPRPRLPLCPLAPTRSARAVFATPGKSSAGFPGATVAEGKYAVIRGLTDRYSAATLNGAELPSADPYRRSAGLDLFPAKIIDRVTVTKTFTPDQPGSFTGGNINIVTKSFPEKGFVSRGGFGLQFPGHG